MLLQRNTFGRRLLANVGASLVAAAALFAAAGAARAQSNPSVDTTKIIIGENNSGTAWIPLYAAFDQGFFKKEGVDVEAQLINGGTPAAMAAFSTGSVNILSISAPELVEYTGSKVITGGKAFAEIGDSVLDILTAKNITSFQDIKGKTIGISGPNAGDWIYFVAILQHYGISANDVTFITAGTPANRLASLAAGAVQVIGETNDVRDRSTKVGNILMKSGDSPVKFPSNLFVASSDLITNHKPLLKKFVTAMSEATAWVQANQDAAAALCAKTIGAAVQDCANSIKLDFDRSISSPYTWSSTYAVNVDGFKAALAVMATLQPDTKSVTLDDVLDTSIAGTTP